MKTTNLLFAVLFCAFVFLMPNTSYSQTVDSDNDTIKDFFDVDDDNDGLLDVLECPPISGAANPRSDKINWTKNGFNVYTIGGNTNGLGFQESGFQQKVLSKGQPLTVLNGFSDFSFPATSSIGGSAPTSVGTFANGNMTFEHNYLYRSYEISQFRVTGSGGFTSGSGPSNGVYVYPEVGNQTGDYYTVTINFTEPVASFSFDFVDIYDTNNDGATVNYEVYADGNLIAYFKDNYIGGDAVANIDLFDADGVFKGAVSAGQNRENTIGFVTDDVVSQIQIRHIVTAGGLAASTHDPHGLDSFAYSFRCEPQIDIDVDNDGIPDNIEAQPTATYAAPSGAVNTSGSFIGLYTNYGSGLTPEDTDGDSIPDYLDTDTDNDGIPDIEENGMANTASVTDTDNDGLSNTFEGSNINDPFDSNDDINDPRDLSILPDGDGDLPNGGDLDYRDDLDVFIENATIDFDGVDDYIDSDPFITNWTNGTIMGWVKIEHDSDGTLPNSYSVAGQENMRLYITRNRTPAFYVITQDQVTSGSNFPSNNIQVQPDPLLNIEMENNLWYHVAGVFNSADQSVKLYLNGELVGTENDALLNSELLTRNFNGTPHIYSQREFTIGRYPTNTSVNGFDHFRGSIDEVRIFDSALSDEQLQQMVYQEIENNGGNIKGKVLPKDVQNLDSGVKVSWNSLQAYYPMTDIVNSRSTSDFSNNSHKGILHNITTIQPQTAPMPYVTQSNGNWLHASTWLHGDVWDITDAVNVKDWSIIDVKHNIRTNVSNTTLGLFIKNGKTLRVNDNIEINNTWYLELNGSIDLKNDSQLVQGVYSDLVTSATGKIIRRQEGLSNVFRYNYWSSPIGTQAATSFIDNNTASNNTNNTTYSLDMLKDGSGNIQFTGNFSPPATTPATLSTRWLYIYQNGVSYYDWDQVSPSTDIPVGVGYSQKGTGLGTGTYQYLFEGKPNNGTILLSATDTGGAGSVGGTSKTQYLVGNPYPSALDAHKFIDDNSTVSGGAVYLWEQWSGNTHYLNEYEGGYATLNKLAKVRAYQFVGLDGANNGSQDGTKVPTRYIPVGQAFMTEIVNNGDIEFNNSQRIFKREDLGESIFFRNANANNEVVTVITEEEDEIQFQKIKLEFKTSNNLSRELVLGFSDQTSDDFDYGYDARLDQFNSSDLALAFGNEKMIIQAYASVHEDKIVDLVFNADGNLDYTISILDIENLEASQNVFLLDTQESIYHNLTVDGDYNFTSEETENSSRFKIVFKDNNSLSVEEVEKENSNILIYTNNDEHNLYVKGLVANVKNLNIINMLGQSVQQFNNMKSTAFENGQPLNTVSSGIYIVELNLDNGTTISKKITLK